VPVVLTGASRDKPLAQKMLEHTTEHEVVSLMGQTTLGELGAIFQRARLVVSGDSGPMHIASGVGTPLVTLFGPTNPDLTGPRGVSDQVVLNHVPDGFASPWYEEELPSTGWLSHIQPEEVVEAIEEKGWLKRRLLNVGKIDSKQNKKKSSADQGPRKIMLVTLSNIGDVILTTPVIMALKSSFPDSEITLVVGPRAVELFSRNNSIDKIIVYDKHASLLKQFRFLRELRKTRYDYVVDLRHTAIPFLVRAKKRSPLFRKLQSVLMKERHLEVLKQMGLETITKPFAFFRSMFWKFM